MRQDQIDKLRVGQQILVRKRNVSMTGNDSGNFYTVVGKVLDEDGAELIVLRVLDHEFAMDPSRLLSNDYRAQYIN